MRPPAGRRGRRPLRKGRSVSIFCRGGCQPPESLPPLRGKVPPKGADEGAFLACTLPGGRPKGLPYPIPEEFLESRRGGRLPLSRGDVERSETKGIGICPSCGPASVRPLRNGMTASSPAVGAAHRAARKPSPYKGADSPYQGEMSRSDRGDRDRCPRRGRMRVGSGMAEAFHRAGQCPAPTKYKTP